jgi:hypothetical protein
LKKLALALFGLALALGAACGQTHIPGAAPFSGDPTTTTTTSASTTISPSRSWYAYKNGDYPNGWTESQVQTSAMALAGTSLSADTSVCLLHYEISHYTPSEFLAANPATVVRQANC